MDNNNNYSQLHRGRIHERTISLTFLGIILRVLRLEVSYTMFTLQTSFKPLLLKGWGGGIKSVSRGDFCLNDVQEFGLWVTHMIPKVTQVSASSYSDYPPPAYSQGVGTHQGHILVVQGTELWGCIVVDSVVRK